MRLKRISFYVMENNLNKYNCKGIKLRKIKQTKLIKKRGRKTEKAKKRSGIKNRHIFNLLFKQLINRSKLFVLFNKKKFYKKPYIIDEKAIITIPEIFSFSKNAYETLNILKELAYAIRNELKIFITHERCIEIDLAASLVMDTIIMEYKNLAKKAKLKINVSGILSNNEKVNEILSFSGILNTLNINKSRNDSRLKLLPMVRNEEAGKMTTDIIEYFDNCLQTQGCALNDEGRYAFSKMIGEVLNNCHDHGGNNVQWYALGHYNCGDGEFNLTIFDFGDTIYEGLKNEKASLLTKNKLTEMTNHHRKIFENIDEELYWTLFSLQHGISRLNSEKDNTRGQGTIDLIDSFQTIGYKSYKDLQRNPIMSITSGNINIVFNGKYELEENSDGVKIIAFNENNDLKEKPDFDCVKNINNFFPGTIISIRFCINRKYIIEENIKNES